MSAPQQPEPAAKAKTPTEVEVEYIPPSQQQGHPMPNTAGLSADEKHATARIIAHWLDEFIKIPGTTFRIGLDPIISLVPGVGDFLASSVSLVTIIESVRTGVPITVITRMGFNMVINAMIGAIPVIGPVFSAFYKSNSRNLAILRRWQDGEKHAVVKGSRRLLLFVVIISFLALATYLCLWAWAVWTLTRPFFAPN
jgi:Domain of unknown function (DUF4112)